MYFFCINCWAGVLVDPTAPHAFSKMLPILVPAATVKEKNSYTLRQHTLSARSFCLHPDVSWKLLSSLLYAHSSWHQTLSSRSQTLSSRSSSEIFNSFAPGPIQASRKAHGIEPLLSLIRRYFSSESVILPLPRLSQDTSTPRTRHCKHVECRARYTWHVEM